MTILRRPTAASRVLDLTRTLAEEYDSVPLPAVSEAVRSAAQTVDLQSTDVAAALSLLERKARRELGDPGERQPATSRFSTSGNGSACTTSNLTVARVRPT